MSDDFPALCPLPAPHFTVRCGLSIALLWCLGCSSTAVERTQGDTRSQASVDMMCTPSCADAVCGSDGCGGTCGICPAGRSCLQRTCVSTACQPNCTGRDCGSDGCGGHCGTCVDGLVCSASASCRVASPTCEIQCDGRVCGPNGCGGVCGLCEGDSFCVKDGRCRVVGDACAGTDANGYCDGNTLVYCSDSALVALPCADDEVCA
ncbi:MAG: hypothetical protein VX223_13950 [Myxococcota bacterium]|nr:hypothetical protein [Myxococcota bacterium]